MKKYYYHITSPKNVHSIITEGLKCNGEGDIFLFEAKILIIPEEYRAAFGNKTQIVVAEHIARNQVFLKDYVIFEIDSEGINGEITQDNVAEITAEYQWIVKQQLIEPRFLCPVAEGHLD